MEILSVVYLQGGSIEIGDTRSVIDTTCLRRSSSGTKDRKCWELKLRGAEEGLQDWGPTASYVLYVEQSISMSDAI